MNKQSSATKQTQHWTWAMHMMHVILVWVEFGKQHSLSRIHRPWPDKALLDLANSRDRCSTSERAPHKCSSTWTIHGMGQTLGNSGILKSTSSPGNYGNYEVTYQSLWFLGKPSGFWPTFWHHFMPAKFPWGYGQRQEGSCKWEIPWTFWEETSATKPSFHLIMVNKGFLTNKYVDHKYTHS